MSNIHQGQGSQQQQSADDHQAAEAAQKAKLAANQAEAAAQQATSASTKVTTAAEKLEIEAARPSHTDISPSPVTILPIQVPAPVTTAPIQIPSETKPQIRPDFALEPACFSEFEGHPLELSGKPLEWVEGTSQAPSNATTSIILYKDSGKNHATCGTLTLLNWSARFADNPAVPTKKIVVHYVNLGNSDLDLLDFQSSLVANSPAIGAYGAIGACPSSRTGVGSRLWERGESIELLAELRFGPSRSSKERKQAQADWTRNDGQFYLILCTTVRSPGLSPVLVQAAYKITREQDLNISQFYKSYTPARSKPVTTNNLDATKLSDSVTLYPTPINGEAVIPQ